MGSGGPEKVVVPLMALGMDSMALNQLKGQTYVQKMREQGTVVQTEREHEGLRSLKRG
jgi:hypothetical protein